MTANSNAFTEWCLVGIKSELDSVGEIQLAGIVEDIGGIDLGDKDIEGLPLVNGGRAVKKKPQDDESITLKCYPIGVANDGTGTGNFFGGTAAPGTADPSTILNAITRRRHRIILTWRDDFPFVVGTVGAGSLIPTGVSALQLTAVNAYAIHDTYNFDDKILGSEITFKWTPFDKSANPNRKITSCIAGGITATTSTPTSL